MSLTKSFFTVGSLTLVSRVFGFIRDILIAAIMGAGPLTEAFLVAFKLPNFFRRLFAEGAFNAAFVPMFAGMLATEGQEKARLFGEKIFSVLLFSLLIFTLVMQVAMPLVMYVLAPGFADDKEKFDLAVYLTRITFPYLLFVSLVSFLAGVLNCFNKFAAVAASPIILNLCLIPALLFFAEKAETPAHALSYGVALAGVLQFLWLYLSCKKIGITFKIRRPKLSPEIRAFLKRMAPGIIGAGVVQINLWIDIIIGTFIPSAIAYLYYADRINQLPLSIVGTAMGVALLPSLSKQIRENKSEEAMNSQNRALEIVLFLILPATAALIIISHPIISVLFERGKFGAAESLATSYGLIAYAVGLPAFVMVKIFSTSFFSHGDTKTPVKIAIMAMISNVILNVAFIFLFMRIGIMPHIGIALATSISSWLNVGFLCMILVKRGRFGFDKRIKKRFWRILLSVAFMSFTLWFLLNIFSEMLKAGQIEKIISLVAIIIIGGAVYLITAKITGVFDAKMLKKSLKREKQNS